jgi:hypothetical protein
MERNAKSIVLDPEVPWIHLLQNIIYVISRVSLGCKILRGCKNK